MFDIFDNLLNILHNIFIYKYIQKQKTNFCIWDNMEGEKSEYENCETIEIAVNKSYEDSWNYHPLDVAYLHRITINGET